MDTLFLDANILFSAAYRESAGLLKFWGLSNAKLITSAYAIEEARRNLKENKQQDRLLDLIKRIKIINEISIAHYVQDIKLAQKDLPILAAAIAGKADYLITGDIKDFGRFFTKKIQGVIILPPIEYFKLLNYSL